MQHLCCIGWTFASSSRVMMAYNAFATKTQRWDCLIDACCLSQSGNLLEVLLPILAVLYVVFRLQPLVHWMVWLIHFNVCLSQSKNTIHLSYHDGEHYNSVRNTNDYDEGPPTEITIIEGKAKLTGSMCDKCGLLVECENQGWYILIEVLRELTECLLHIWTC